MSEIVAVGYVEGDDARRYRQLMYFRHEAPEPCRSWVDSSVPGVLYQFNTVERVDWQLILERDQSRFSSQLKLVGIPTPWTDAKEPIVLAECGIAQDALAESREMFLQFAAAELFRAAFGAPQSAPKIIVVETEDPKTVPVRDKAEVVRFFELLREALFDDQMREAMTAPENDYEM